MRTVVMMMSMIMTVIMSMTRNRVGGGEDEAAGLDPLGADQVVGQLADELGGTTEQDHFETAVRVEMDVGRGHHSGQMQVLDLGEALADPAGVVVIDQGDDPHRVALVVRDRFLDQGRAHQPSDRLAPIRILVLLAIMVKLVEKFAADRDAEADEWRF